MKRRTQRWAAPIFLVSLLVPACAAPRRTPATSPPPPGLARADHVVIVVVDGLRPDAITPEEMPRLTAVLERSARTLQARTVVPGITVPAHVSLLSGLDPREHGVLWNTYDPDGEPITVPTVFDAARSAGLSTALFAGKLKLVHLATPELLDRVDAEDRDDAEVMALALEHLRISQPALTLIHLGDVDHAGHAWGWMGRRQREVIRRVDGLLGQLIDTLVEMRRESSWALVLTADHGGEGSTHGGREPSQQTIPWLIWGDGVQPREIDPVSITATAIVVLDVLGLPQPEDEGGR